MDELQSLLNEQKFSLMGWAPLSTPLSLAHYDRWLEKGFYADMNYLVNHRDVKARPEKHFPTMRSALVVGKRYQPRHPYADSKHPLKSLKVARYARGADDYHLRFKEELKELGHQLQAKYPEASILTATDSFPLLERDLAYQAGLGWVGKNTCLINRGEGSFFLLGEILTSLPAEWRLKVSPDHCGTCTRCLDACPTGALIEPRVLDARRCISYWTIESSQVPPAEIRDKIGGLFFGCDICQDVCPWNQKWLKLEFQPGAISEEAPARLGRELKFILESSNRQLIKAFATSPLLRARPWGLKRNAILVATNLGLRDLWPQIKKYREHPKLGELVEWSGARLGFTNSQF